MNLNHLKINDDKLIKPIWFENELINKNWIPDNTITFNKTDNKSWFSFEKYNTENLIPNINLINYQDPLVNYFNDIQKNLKIWDKPLDEDKRFEKIKKLVKNILKMVQ